MAVEAVNAAGGVGGRPLRVLARDTRSNPTKVAMPGPELVDAGAVMFIGPDTTDLVDPADARFWAIAPSSCPAPPPPRTSSGGRPPGSSWGRARAGWPASWWPSCAPTGAKPAAAGEPDRPEHRPVLGPGPAPTGCPRWCCPTDQPTTIDSVRPHHPSLVGADAYVLAAFPTSASSLVYALAAHRRAARTRAAGTCRPPCTPPPSWTRFPRGLCDGARGVAPGTVTGAADFRARFAATLAGRPLDDAYPFYDAGAIAALALARATS